MKKYDLVFIGHMCRDEIIDPQGNKTVSVGSAVLCGAMAAVKCGKSVAAVVKMDPEDRECAEILSCHGIDVHIIPAKETSYMRVEHPSQNLDERRMTLLHNAGRIEPGELPDIQTKKIHLAGISDQEFSLDLIRYLRGSSLYSGTLSADMQSFVRRVDPLTRHVSFSMPDEPEKIVSFLDCVKLDNVEALILTGEEDLEKAARKIAGWGCGELIISSAKRAVCLADGQMYSGSFCNRNSSGRTGRGDTLFGSYLSARLNREPEEAFRFALTLVSIKMETPGPFCGTLEQVLSRMGEVVVRRV